MTFTKTKILVSRRTWERRNNQVKAMTPLLDEMHRIANSSGYHPEYRDAMAKWWTLIRQALKHPKKGVLK